MEKSDNIEKLAAALAKFQGGLEEARKELAFYKDWKDREADARKIAEKKLVAAKAFFEVV